MVMTIYEEAAARRARRADDEDYVRNMGILVNGLGLTGQNPGAKILALLTEETRTEEMDRLNARIEANPGLRRAFAGILTFTIRAQKEQREKEAANTPR